MCVYDKVCRSACKVGVLVTTGTDDKDWLSLGSLGDWLDGCDSACMWHARACVYVHMCIQSACDFGGLWDKSFSNEWEGGSFIIWREGLRSGLRKRQEKGDERLRGQVSITLAVFFSLTFNLMATDHSADSTSAMAMAVLPHKLLPPFHRAPGNFCSVH